MKAAKLRKSFTAYGFILPAYAVHLTFVVIPIFWVIFYSFTNYNLFTLSFVGLKNFEHAFRDPTFLRSVVNTFVYAAGTIFPQIVGGLIFAVLLNLSFLRFRSGFRVILFLPIIVSVMSMAVTWLYLYDPVIGPIDTILIALGLPRVNWLTNTNTALLSVVITGVWWRLGYNMVIYLAALQSIPDQLYEAARIDGCGSVRSLFGITIPLVKPTTFFLLVVDTVASFQVFGQVLVMTGGGPANATTTIVHQIYLNTFQGFRLGYAAALSVILLVLLGVVTLFNYAWSGRGNVEYS